MPHPVGERLRCDDCGAEIEFVKACPCPDAGAHSDKCCGKEMRIITAGVSTAPAQPHHHHH